jgi:hypothetical protein
MTLAEWQATELFAYLTNLPGRCFSCAWHVATQNHRPDCSKGKLTP